MTNAESDRLHDLVLERCTELGFVRVGICDAIETSHREDVLRWLADGRHASMGYLQDRIDERLDPDTYMQGAKSIICVADRYHDGEPDRVDSSQGPRGRIARYARGRDYHKVMKKRLVRFAKELSALIPDANFRACVDTAPLLEREHAARAGLGMVGKNTLLIEPGVGSWMLLGAIVSSVKIRPSTSTFTRPDPCLGCTRCIDACPTDAITPFSVDARRCIAHSTIEDRGVVDDEIAKATGHWLFGCDICQEVCPHGSRSQSQSPPVVNEAYQERHTDLDLLEILGWSDSDRMNILMGSAAKRANLSMWKRNAIICACNAMIAEPSAQWVGELKDRITGLALDDSEDDMIRETARWAITRMPSQK